MKFIDLFAGIGGFRLGMESAGHECVAFCEIDKFARSSYKAIHYTEGEEEFHDITSVTDEQWSKYQGTVDVICGGFPCQAFSVAGKRQGFLDETRGTLFFEIARAAKQIKPRILFLENVKGLLSHDKGRTFGIILNTLDELGYDCEWQVLNSKNFGVPQNRERVFIIGHLRGTSGREVFPITGNDTKVNNKRIKKVGNIRKMGKSQSGDVFDKSGLAPTLCSTTTMKDPPKIVVANKEKGMPRETNRVYNSDGLSPTLNTMQGGGREPKILVKEATKKGYAVAGVGDSINISHPTSKTRRGRVGKQIANTLLTGEEQAVVIQKPRGFNNGGEHKISPTLSSNSWQENNFLRDGFRIRKLTPRECWRLQGFPDWAFEKAAYGKVIPDGYLKKYYKRQLTKKEWKIYWNMTKKQRMSNSQLYKQAGNSVTVNVIAEIANKLEDV